MKLLQILDFLMFLNVDVPTNVQAMYAILNTNVMQIIPNLFERDEKQLKCNLHPIFFNNDLKCLMVNNIGSTIEWFILAIVIKVIIFVIYRLLLFPYPNIANEIQQQKEITCTDIQ